MPILYAQSSGTQQQFLQPTPIAGLSLVIPEGAGMQALIILNVPNPYADVVPPILGGWFGISVDGVTLPVFAAFTSGNSQMFSQTGRGPTTLVIAVPLKEKPQTIVALAATCTIDSPATLSVSM